MDYVDPAEAETLVGLRLALTARLPAPYSMSAKAIFDLKQVPYIPVVQKGGGANDALVAWTGHRNAPIAVYESEAPRVGWLEILHLAERLGHGPSLLPTALADRMQMVALTSELIGENGFIWNLRLIMLGLGGIEAAASAAKKNPMYADYGYSEVNRVAATQRCREFLEYFTEYARGQSHYLVADKLSALDVYWVYFSQLLKTLPAEISPTPAGLRKSYDMGSELLGGCESFLIEKRDWILANHLSTPLEF